MSLKFKDDDKVDESSLSYIRGRYGPGSKEYIEALLEHNRCYSGAPIKESSVPILKPIKADKIVEFDAAELVNSMSEEKRTHSEPTVVERLPGETPLEFARRKRHLAT